MASIQERLQIKRVPIDKWSIREQLCLASAVGRSGDQNWMSVSRALKPFGDANRPADWFSQKNCAAQYGSLLENVETPKRKKRTSVGPETIVETPGESILKKLTQERIQELKNVLESERQEYLKLKEEIDSLKGNTATEVQIEDWRKQFDDEDKQKDKDALAHALWLKEREQRKQEVERAWRPIGKPSPVSGQKRKASESLDSLTDTDGAADEAQEPAKPALSPLLTSLLKSPSQTANAATSILHSAITSNRSTPTIASLLNSTTNVAVSPGLQQLVTTAIGQEPVIAPTPLPNTDSSIAAQQSSSSSSTDTDQQTHTNLSESTDVLNENSSTSAATTDKSTLNGDEETSETTIELNLPTPASEPTHPSDCDNGNTEDAAESNGAASLDAATPGEDKSKDSLSPNNDSLLYAGNDMSFENDEPSSDSSSVAIKKEVVSEPSEKTKEPQSGSVEIVEVLMEDEDSDKELSNSFNMITADSLHTQEYKNQIICELESSATTTPTTQKNETDTTPDDSEKDVSEEAAEIMPIGEESKEANDGLKESTGSIDIDLNDSTRRSTSGPEYTEAFLDDVTIEVRKMDKSGRAKRDYTRNKKKEDKDFDILLAVEKAVSSQLEVETELIEETSSEKEFHDVEKKSDVKVNKVKSENERSVSPWTEEEEVSSVRTRRRYSTPATPIDSIPNSPASSSAYYDDDRDYRNWKKSAMLIHNRLATHKYASLFLKPITDDQAPGYHSLIYRAMDLQTLRKNIETGVVRTTAEFQRDVLLMFTNAVMYNKTKSHVFNMARQMQQESLQQLQIFLQAQKEGETPGRRETRTSEPNLKRKRGHEDVVRSKKRREDLAS